MKDYGFITVRTGSERLPNKCLLPFGDGNVLEHVINRAKHFGFEPVVCTTWLPEDKVILKIAKMMGCEVHAGEPSDKLLRWHWSCRYFGAEDFHTIDADDPFFDPTLVRASLWLLRQGYDMVKPPPDVYVGACGYSLTRDIVERACEAKQTEDTEMHWRFIEDLPDVKVTTLCVDSDTSNLRLTLDYEEDYWLLKTVLRVLGPYATREDIEEFFSNSLTSPLLRGINWFRQEEYERRQVAV